MLDSFWLDRDIPRVPPYSSDPNRVTYFAETDSRGRKAFGIKEKDRTRHTYVIGKTGMGKSTLLENMAVQDMHNGEGLCFIDPHGKTADLLLDYVPEDRIKDVLYFAPFDIEHPVSFNIMEDVGEDKRHLVVSGLMSAFKKLWGEESFSDRMQYILQNTLHALLEYPGETLLGVNRMYSDPKFRKKVVENIQDMSVKDYWEKEFAGYTERFAAEATPAIQNKVGQYTSNPLIRNVIGQPKSSFDFREIMDNKKIMIVNLSKGLVGEGNANLLGSMVITKLYLAAMSRADAKRGTVFSDFHLYVDEFQSFANESFANILSEARKYNLTLTVAHQYIAQMSEEVRDAVIGNVGTMIMFRVGGADAEILEKEFGPTFVVEDMVNLGFTQLYIKLMIDGVSSAPFSATTLPPIPNLERSFRDEIIESSRKQFARPRKEVEEEIRERQGKNEVKEIPQRKDAPRKEDSAPRKDNKKVENNVPKKEEHVSAPSQEQEKKKNPFANISLGANGKLQADKENNRPEEKISLKIIENQKKPRRGHEPDKKGPTPERVADLKNALSSLISGKSTEQKKEFAKGDVPAQKTIVRNIPKPETSQPQQVEEKKKTKPNEIPKSELENMLKIDE